MAGQKKRIPIKSKVLFVVLLISVMALLVTSFMSILSMMKIQDKSEEALIMRMENNLLNVVDTSAEVADSELLRYSSYVTEFADYIHGLYMNPDDYVMKEVLPADPANAGVFVMQRAYREEGIAWDDVKDIGCLLANTEQIFHPVIAADDSVIVSIYLGTERGLTLSYDKQSDIKPPEEKAFYDYTKSSWYPLAKDEGKACFTDVYQDNLGRGLTITCAAPFYDENDKFAGVVGMDILITDLYRTIAEMNFGEDAEDAYAFLVDKQGNLISPDGEGGSLYDDPDLDKKTIEGILSGHSNVSRTDKGFYYAYAPVESTSWKLCIHMPESMITAPAKAMDLEILKTINNFILILIVIVLIVFLVVQRFASSLTKPLIALGNDARLISEGNLDHQATVYNNDEIGDLAVSFNHMAVNLKKYIEDLTNVTAEKERIGAELNVATQIQADMLPRIFPPFPDKKEFDLYATMAPAKEVGGDFYDFFLIDDDHLGLVMADVSGKGVPAALFMVIAKTLIKNRAMMGGSPAEVLSYANEQLCEGNEAELFVTVWLAILQISTGKGVAANAGHEHPAIKRAGGEFELVVYRHSPAVATMEGMKFKEHEFELNPGDSLYVYTDGVTEATNSQNELYGTDRMLEALNKDPDAPGKELLKNVRDSIDEFVGEAPQFDDITMLGLTFFG